MKQELTQKDLNTKERAKFSTKTIAKIGVLGAVATVIMIFEFPLPFAPNFYKLDFSEIPVMIGAFALGPIAGVVIEFIKILLNFVINGTVTAGIGELGNFLIGCALVVPTAIVYKKNKTFKNAIIGLAVGVFSLAIAGALLNYFLLIPAYSVAYGAPVQAFIDMGNAINKSIVNLETLVLYAVVPFNIVKGVLVSVITMLVYKRLSPLLHK